MAIDADISLPAMSPRISFSHDFIHSESIPVEQPSSFNSTFDFDFCIHQCPHQQPSSADQIFSHGKILPLQISDRSDPPPAPPPPSSPPLTRPKSLEINPQPKQASNSKSFWHFKRSTSCGSAYTRSLCPLPLLSRSNSTGSTRTPPLPKDGGVPQKQSSLRNASKNSQMGGYHKPPLKKVHGLYGNGLPPNPTLNVHSGNLFGLASIFSSAKDRSKRK